MKNKDYNLPFRNGKKAEDLSSLTTQISSLNSSLADITNKTIDVRKLKNDTNALQTAINNSPVNSIIDFGDATNLYNLTSVILLQPNRTYKGNATIKQTSTTQGTAIFKATTGNDHDITIDGLTFDANNIGSCLQFGNGGTADSSPTSYIDIKNCTFKNSLNVTSWTNNSGINAVASGFHWSRVSGCKFINCGDGVSVGNAHFSIIEDNYFDGMTTGNCIYIINYARNYTYGNGIVIKNNVGRNLFQAGITIFNSGGNTSLPEGVVIEGNIFKDWQANATTDDYSTCFSLVTGKNYVISNNQLLNGKGLYGIECGVTNPQINNNKISGFQNGIILNIAPYAIVNSNHISSPSVTTGAGIILSGAASPHSKITNNIIKDCGSGITIGVSSDNVTVTDNQVLTTASGNGIEIVNGGNDNIISDNLIIDSFKYGVQISNGSGSANRVMISKNKVSFVSTRTTYAPTGIRVMSTTDTFVNGNTVDTNVANASTNYFGLIHVEGTIVGCTIVDNKVVGNVSTPIDHRGINAAGSSNLNNVYILNNVVRGLTTGIHLANATTISNVVISGNHPRECTSAYQRKGGEITNTLRISEDTGIPITGTWVKGDRIVNSNPAVGSPKAWVCTVTGSPGTWVSEGNL